MNYYAKEKRKDKKEKIWIIKYNMSDNILIDKTKAFALGCIILYKKLQEQNEYVISTQLLRSSTSIGANLREAIAGQSKKDFYSKICIAFKEAYESDFWLELLHESELTAIDVTELREQCKEIKKLLGKTKLTTEQNMQFEKS